MTNRDIAQALFVAARTVEMHLSNAFRKLEIGSRTQLVDALARAPDAGLLTPLKGPGADDLSHGRQAFTPG